MLLLGLIVSLCYIPGWTGASIPTQWAVLSIALPWGLYRSGPITALHLVGLAFVAYATLSLAWISYTFIGIYHLWFIYLMALSLWLGTTLESLHSLFSGLAIGCAVSSTVGIIQFLGAAPFPTYGFDSTAAGLFFNPVAQGSILTLTAVALLTYSEWLPALALAPGILLSGSRGSWLAFLIALLGFRFRTPLVLAAVLCLALTMLLIPTGLSDQTRLFIWTQAFAKLTPFGHGVGTFSTLSGVFQGKPIYPENAHNDLLQLVFEYGIFALAPTLIFLALLDRSTDPHWPIILTFITMGLYFFPLYVPITSFIAMVTAGHMLRNWALDGGLWYLRGPDLLQRLSPSKPILDEPRSPTLPVVS